MTNSAWIDATGHGQIDFNGGSTIHPVAVVCSLVSLTNPKVRVIDSDFPRMLRYAGIIGFVTPDLQPDGSTANAMANWHRLEWEFEEWQCEREEAGPFLASVLVWRLPIDIEFNFQVFW